MSPRFTSPPDPKAYNAAVWAIVRQIPPGRVSTYGRIAALVALPVGMDPKDYAAFGPRWVGGAMAACPEGVPWQRVVNAQGKISLRPGQGSGKQRELLEDEGVEFGDRDRIDLDLFGWEGPSKDNPGS